MGKVACFDGSDELDGGAYISRISENLVFSAHRYIGEIAVSTINKGDVVVIGPSRSLGRTGCQSVCHLVGGRAPRAAVRLNRNFHVVRWSGRRLALPMAPKGGQTPTNGILSDFRGIVAAEWSHLLLRAGFARSAAQVRGLRNGPSAARFGHGVDSGDRRASP